MRVTAERVGLDELPDVAVSFRDFTRTHHEPQASIWSEDHGSHIDINELSYAEIWASFIPSVDARGDFMRTGYKDSARVVGPEIEFAKLAGHLEPRDRWATRSGYATRAEIARDLRNRLLLFSSVMPPLMGRGQQQLTVPGGLGSPGTTIDVDARVPAGALAFRRRPWEAPKQDILGRGLIIACSFSAHRVGLHWLLRPRVVMNRADDAMDLLRGDGFAFWFVLPSVILTRPNSHRTAFTFQIDVMSAQPVDYANVFFRVPQDYTFREGGLTELRRYPAPPRLFTLWDRFLACDCYVAHAKAVPSIVPHTINAEFLYSKLDLDKVKSIFALGVILNGYLSLIVNIFTVATIYTDDKGPDLMRMPSGLDVPIGHASITLGVMALLLGVVIYLVYSNRLRPGRWLAGAIIAAGILLVVAVLSLSTG